MFWELGFVFLYDADGDDERGYSGRQSRRCSIGSVSGNRPVRYCQWSRQPREREGRAFALVGRGNVGGER